MGGKLKAAIILVGVFALGMASGVAWDVHRSHHKRGKWMFGERRIAHLKKELQLNPWQEQTLREIVQDARERANDAQNAMDYDLALTRAHSIDAIEGALTPEQKEKFSSLRARMRSKHRGKWGKDKDRPDNGVSTPAPASEPDLATAHGRLQAERQHYFAVVQKSGPDSSEAHQARVQYDAARQTWRATLDQQQAWRQQARRALRERRQAARTPTHGS